MDFAANFSKFVYRGDSKKVKIYELVSGVYQEEFSFDTGGTVYSAKMDENELYYIITDDNSNLYTFFHCPFECSSCSFPNNCSACSPDYSLSGSKCLRNIESNITSSISLSVCVKNVYVAENIC